MFIESVYLIKDEGGDGGEEEGETVHSASATTRHCVCMCICGYKGRRTEIGSK